MSRETFCPLSIGLSMLSSILWAILVLGTKFKIDIEGLIWGYGLIFIIMGIAMIETLKKYSNDIISNIQNSIRKDILRPFRLLPEDVDRAVARGSPIYVEGPDRDIFYMMEDITNSGSTIESVVTGDRFPYRGDIRGDLKGLIADGFHVYLKQAYDEMISCGFEVYKYR